MSRNRKTKTKIKGKKLTSRELQTEIFRLFKRHSKKRLNPRQVIQKLKIDNNKDSVQHAIDKLVEQKKLINLEDYKYQVNLRATLRSKTIYEGRVDMTRSGSAYIVSEQVKEDIHVSAKYLHTAQNGDQVKVRAWTPRGRRKMEGEVTEVLKRATEHFIGTYWEYPQYALVVPDGKMSTDILVDRADSLPAEDGDKVVIKIIDWKNSRHNNPLGVITSVLGKAGSSDIEMKSILINNGFQLDFPEPVMRESEALATEIEEEEITRRRDMRAVSTFTIDPETAKDFDDALSIRYLEDGQCEVGVHIADVTHYVRENTLLDKEAYQRSTSVYLVDRVLPMLPEKLSNELCSLRPEEDKLTFSAIFTFNRDGKIVDRWFGKTIIHSDRRFTYEEAQEVLETKQGPFADELAYLNKLALKLRREKFRKGAINFESDEVKFRLDEDGTPLEVYLKERKDTHLLIEDFMLLANREVSTYMYKKGVRENQEIPFVYRIHDEPDPDKAVELARFAREMGVEMDVSTPRLIAKSYNNLTKAAENDPGLKLLLPIAIRTMAKAVYSSQNIGHYGLGFDQYSHFTSPIRRYSDVLTHRILEQNLDGKTKRVNPVRLEEQCGYISRQERRAVDAERESVKYKQVEFMEKHLGEEFDGFISGISERGLFVELAATRCEGMINFSTVNEPFEVSDSRLFVTGTRTGVRIKMGDSIRVKIVDTDLGRRRIDMTWVR